MHFFFFFIYLFLYFSLYCLSFKHAFSFSPCKKLYYFHLVQGTKEGPRVVKRLPCGYGKGLQGEALTPEGLLRGLRALEAPGQA